MVIISKYFGLQWQNSACRQTSCHWSYVITRLFQADMDSVFGQPFLKRFAYRTAVLSVYRPRPWPHCVRWGSSSPTERGTATPTFEIYGRMLCLRPYNPRSMSIIANGWMDQDETWHGGRPRPSPNCVKWGPSFPPQRGTAPNFRPMPIVAKRLDGSRCHLVGR